LPAAGDGNGRVAGLAVRRARRSTARMTNALLVTAGRFGFDHFVDA
jgi:hypothetical protein